MAKRILDLAKELGTDAAEIQRLAVSCNVAVSGPTSTLDVEDQDKIRQALKKKPEDEGAGAHAKTLTLNRPTIAGQARSGPRVEGRGRTVEVAVRRRHVPVRPGSQNPLGDTPPNAANAASPAERAAAAVEKKRVAAPAAKPPVQQPAPEAAKAPVAASASVAAKAPAAAKPRVSPAQRAAEAMAAQQQAAPAATVPAAAAPVPARTAPVRTERHAPVRAERPAGARAPGTPNSGPRGAARPGRPGARPGSAESTPGQPSHKGPRTTIRRGLTPAQIAASKAPRSTVKQIEKKISEDRANRRDTSPRPGARPTGAGAGAAGQRRSPSVAISPDATTAAPGAPRRRTDGPGGRPQRRLSPAEKAARRSYSEKRNQVLTPQQEERMARLARGSRKNKGGITKDDEDFVIRTVEVTDPILVSELANRMAIKSSEVVKKLFEMGIMTTVNESVDADTSVLIVEEFGHKAKIINAAAVEDVLIEEPQEDDSDELFPRPPVVVVMGHVDHGKTSILDALRKANVADGEAGGITQHIGAYMVKLESQQRVVFIDTPGHEAFTGLRARGASLTDVAVLVVAADDGVMPQTIEAVNHARAAGVPIIVAVNKMDKEGADPDKVKRQLAEIEVVAEDWGGDTMFVPVSAKTGEGLDDLLEMLALQTEILELKANPTRRGKGIVIESRLDRGRGPVATVLVKNGTFNQGDTVVVGSVTGRIRAIVDENGKQHRTAGPSIPFELLGLDSVPEAGQELYTVENDRVARDIVSYRKVKERELGADAMKRASLDELFADMQSGIKEVPVIIKGDVTGSVEALAESMAKAGTDDVKVKVVHKGIGGITESDVMLASASNSIIIGFNVRPETKAKKLAEVEGVDIRFYKVIYDAIDEIKAAMAGVLAPNKIEKVTGTAEVREVFQTPKVGAVAGSYVTDGFVGRNSLVRVLRDGVLVYDGVLSSLRRFKDDVKEVKTGYECGIGVDKFNDVKPGDTFEFYIIVEVAATL